MPDVSPPTGYIPAKVFTAGGDYICDADLILDGPILQRLKLIGCILDDETEIGCMAFEGGHVIVEYGVIRRRAEVRGSMPFSETIYIRFEDTH